MKQYHARERSLARQWYARGEEKLNHGNPEGAIPNFRTALFHAEGNPIYQLRLAQSLVISGHVEEARIYLLRLWETNPADGPVNLELAHLAMRKGNIPQAINYYHNAIDGVWPEGSTVQRRDLRYDLCEYLISHNQRSEALAELVVLSSETPNNPKLLIQLAGLYLKVQDYDSALKEFLLSLRLNHRQPEAWAGAGKAAFLMGNYYTARSYLHRALAENPRDTDSAQLLETANNVVQVNPFDRRVPAKTRRRRAIVAFDRALGRLEACAQSRNETLGSANPQTDLQKLYATAMNLKPQMKEKALNLNPDLMDTGMSLVFQIEQTTASECGSPKGIDEALLLIGQKNGGMD